MRENIIVSGSGGQGIILLGKVLAQGALLEDKFVTWLPSYGAEVRGGTAHCMVIISDQEIGSPYIDKADTLIAMNGPSVARFLNRIKKGGLLLANSSLSAELKDKPQGALYLPFSDIALKLGNIRVANMVALGSYLAKKKVLSLKSIHRAICEFAPSDKKDLIAINKEALSCGWRLIDGKG
ncbi:MAG TPA: 2-oxoacid:acceptor oxidoreductase family protein [Candidatus Margulisiibacteriota bacterium]|nr:2-oxoacid:acceptor oxidoreductase family protein [Candidatus Margulisiibacteriota bacterium]